MTETNAALSLRKAVLLTTAIVLAPAAYAGEVAEPMRFSKIVGERPEVKLGRFHEAANDAVCARFRPDEKLARFFLSKAVVVEGEVLEREYPWYPCWIEVAVNGERSFACEISPAGRGRQHPGVPPCIATELIHRFGGSPKVNDVDPVS